MSGSPSFSDALGLVVWLVALFIEGQYSGARPAVEL